LPPNFHDPGPAQPNQITGGQASAKPVCPAHAGNGQHAEQIYGLGNPDSGEGTAAEAEDKKSEVNG